MITPVASARVFRLVKFPANGPTLSVRTTAERAWLSGFRAVPQTAQVELLRLLAAVMAAYGVDAALDDEKGGA